MGLKFENPCLPLYRVLYGKDFPNPKIIPWFKMPTELRSLPYKDRPKALAAWEVKFGVYKGDLCQEQD